MNDNIIEVQSIWEMAFVKSGKGATEAHYFNIRMELICAEDQELNA